MLSHLSSGLPVMRTARCETVVIGRGDDRATHWSAMATAVTSDDLINVAVSDIKPVFRYPSDQGTVGWPQKLSPCCVSARSSTYTISPPQRSQK
jgi:hypothetical protein